MINAPSASSESCSVRVVLRSLPAARDGPRRHSTSGTYRVCRQAERKGCSTAVLRLPQVSLVANTLHTAEHFGRALLGMEDLSRSALRRVDRDGCRVYAGAT